MSLLAPLYLAGLAVLSLPIVLHLIRRVPRGQMPFSSLMFLRESPPRLTRRSRLDQLWLLLLRASIAALLVMAFARPFLRAIAQLTPERHYARRLAVLLDTSASMRRSDLWREAVELVQQTVREAGPRDEVAVFAFDDEVRPIIDFPQELSNAAPPARTIVQQLNPWSPRWRGTDLGTALTVMADRLGERNDRQQSDAALQIIVISDLQQGSDLATLQSYAWPAEVSVDLRALEPKLPGNAGVQVITERTDGDATDELRVLISNDAGSHREQFELAWQSAEETTIGAVTKAYVPPGQSRMVRIRRPVDSPSTALQLTGDSHAFDNTVYVAPLKRATARVVYLGPDPVNDPQGMAYFLERALGDSARWRTQLDLAASGNQLPALLTDAALTVASALERDAAATLRKYAEQGGTVFVSLSAAAPVDAVRELLGGTEVEISESQIDDYAMFAGIDFSHPLFAPLADPQYSDFTKIRFWKTRHLSWPTDSTLRAIARFDDQQPALVEQRVGSGVIYLLASTWLPDDSQLALSSKFVPLLTGMLREAGRGTESDVRLEVGQPYVLPRRDETGPAAVVVSPDGTRHEIGAQAPEFEETEQPGLYRYQAGDREQVVAVNLPAAESRTMPFDASVLEQYGVRIGQQPTAEQQREERRQLQDRELESRQQIWRWMIAAALTLMVVETGLAGRAARSGATAARSFDGTATREEVLR